MTIIILLLIAAGVISFLVYNKYKDKEDVTVIEENGIKMLSDYSAFAMTIDDVKDNLSSFMEDSSQKLKEKDNKYDLQLKNNVVCSVTVDKSGNVKEVNFNMKITNKTTTEEVYYWGYYFGSFVGDLGAEDRDDLKEGTTKVTTDIDSNLKFDKEKEYPQVLLDRYYISNHTRIELIVTGISENEMKGEIMIKPDKKESGEEI